MLPAVSIPLARRALSFLFVFCIWRVSKSLLIMFSVAMMIAGPKITIDFARTHSQHFRIRMSEIAGNETEDEDFERKKIVHTFSIYIKITKNI